MSTNVIRRTALGRGGTAVASSIMNVGPIRYFRASGRAAMIAFVAGYVWVITGWPVGWLAVAAAVVAVACFGIATAMIRDPDDRD